MRRAFLFLLLIALSHSAYAAKTPRYAITDIGPIAEESAVALNNKAQVVGTFLTGRQRPSPDEVSPYSAFLWQNGKRTDLGTMRKHQNSSPTAINDMGQIVGMLEETDEVPHIHWSEAFLWEHGQMRNIDLPGDYRACIVHGINEAGQTVMIKEGPIPPPTAYWITNSGTHQLGVGEAYALNDNGQVVGAGPLSNEDTNQHALLWQDGKRIDLGKTEARGGATAINNLGQIVISRQVTLPAHNGSPGHLTKALELWQSGHTKTLQLPRRYKLELDHKYAINNKGWVVGTAVGPKTYRTAMLWQDDLGCDLNTFIPAQSGWMLQQATGINDKGQIVGIGTYHGKTHAFLLTPRK